MTSPEAQANSKIFYTTLATALAEQEEFSDAHYLMGTVPGVAIPFRVDDYNNYILKDSPVVTQDKEQTAAEYKRLLTLGKACLEVVTNYQEADSKLYIACTPGHIESGFGLLEPMIEAGIDPQSAEIITFNFTDDEPVDPFAVPPLKAIYNHITTT